jgi:hypothetical protein
MIFRKKSFLVMCLTFILLLTGCTNNVEISNNKPDDNIINIGEANYTVKNINVLPIIKEKTSNEEIFVYYANSKYIVYGISYLNSSNEYLLTKNLYTYDYNQGKIINKITFSQDCYVGDAIMNTNSNLYYSVVPINKISTNSAIWEIHSNLNNTDNMIAKGRSSHPDNYPQFALLETNPIYLYENLNDNVSEYGCNSINDNHISTIFKNKSNISNKNLNTLLSCEIVSNGVIASFMNYKDRVLYHTFIDKDGIIQEYEFNNHMYHMGMINNGLIVSKIINQNQSNQYYQISIISPNGKEYAFKNINNCSYYRFTSSGKNESMAVDDYFNLYLFQYKDNSLIRSKLSIDSSVDGKGTTPFFVGGESYLICNFASNNDLQLHIITIK